LQLILDLLLSGLSFVVRFVFFWRANAFARRVQVLRGSGKILLLSQPSQPYLCTRRSTKVTKQALCSALHNACLVTLVDRLLHKSETLLIDGKSYRAHEAAERATEKAKVRRLKGRKLKDDKSKTE
jgi:hypothetical protein